MSTTSALRAEAERATRLAAEQLNASEAKAREVSRRLREETVQLEERQQMAVEGLCNCVKIFTIY